MNVIPTIKNTDYLEDAIKRFENLCMFDFRYVLNKDDIEKQIDFVNNFFNKFYLSTGKEPNIFLDIPCPKDKMRIEVFKDDILQLSKNNTVTLGTFETNSDIYVDYLPDKSTSNFIRLGNSEAILKIINVTPKQWKLLSCYECEIKTGMSIASADGFIINSSKELFDRSCALIENTIPSGLILSYVENKEDIEKYQQYKFDIMSKIETQKSVMNIHEICDNSNSIFIARGCLGVNIGFENLYYTEKHIISTVDSKDIYIGSNILRTLSSGKYPSRSDCCELASMIDLGYNNFVITDGFSMNEKLDIFMDILYNTKARMD